MKTLEELFDEYKAASNMPTKPIGIKKLPANHIEDDNQSVKWNREFVEKNNNDYLKAVADVNRKRSVAMNKSNGEIIKWIQKETKTSEHGAKMIFQSAYDHGHSYGLYAVKDWLEELCELVNECRK